jgi:hypothetical protein
MMDFKGLENDFIVEYCQDNLKAKQYIETICRIASMFDQFNFDMLKAMVEEMNRYGETPQQVMKMLNARPEFSSEARYKVTLQPKGLDIPEDMVDSTEWVGNPLTSRISLDYKKYATASDDPTEISIDDDYDWESCRFTNEDLKQVDANSGKFIFINDLGDRVTLSKVKAKEYHFDAF